MKIDFTKAIARDARILSASQDTCTVCLGKSGGGISFPELLHTDKRYVIGDIEVLEEHSCAMMFRMFTGESSEKERICMRMGILPQFRTRICLDLDLLDNRTIYTNQTPGMLKLVVHGKRTDRSEVTSFEMGIEKTFHDVTVRLYDFYASEERPEFPVPDKLLVDAFGQWAPKEWPGKIHSEEELREAYERLEAQAEYPCTQWNQWGGDSTRVLKPGTGFFSTIKTEDGRWHLVDPDGCEYFSMGPCGVRPGDHGRINGMEKTCEWIPDQDENYQEFLETITRRRTPFMEPETYRLANYCAINLKRIYGESWKEKWEEMTFHILKSNGMNSQGNFSSLHINDGQASIPYVRQLPDFPMTENLIFRDFPDVLSQEYHDNAAIFAKHLEKWKEDPWLIGYFLRNEPEFNFVPDMVIANEVLRFPKPTACRAGLIQYLKERYQENINRLNESWGSDFAAFSDLEAPIPDCVRSYPDSTADLRAFSAYLIREYSRVPSEACRKVDPNHLNLGLRWSQANNADMMAGWEYFDVFSINCYSFDPSKDMEFARKAGVDRPILLGEYHCGALDRGLTATGLKGVTDQEQRGVMWQKYVETVAAHPYGVGAHWFQYNDQFCLGRFDGENYQIGVVDVCMQPYPELAKHIQETAKRLYQVKNGELAPYDKMPEIIPMIGY